LAKNEISTTLKLESIDKTCNLICHIKTLYLQSCFSNRTPQSKRKRSSFYYNEYADVSKQPL